MASETADKEAPLAAADEVIGASESSSQNTEASVKNSQESATAEVKQEEEDAEMPSAAAEPSEDDEMADTKEEEAVPSVEMEEEDAEMSETEESSNEKKQEENESEVENEESVAADSAEAQEKEATETKGSDGDVEMEEEQKTEEAKNEDNEEVSSREKEDADANDKANEEASTSDAVPEDPKKDTTDDDGEKEVSTLEVADAEVPDQGDAEMKDPDNASSPKRKEPLKPSAKPSNGVATPTEPAAKKQKVGGTDAKTTEESAIDAAKDAASPFVMISRDDMAKMEEDSGRLKFDVITNDGTDDHMIQLTTLKNIFAKQLPKMPKEYIVRLVFDKNHKSMLILKNGTHVIGGICYRPFEKNHFAEIAFCAINASDQVKGYGTRLMNHLKEYVKTKNITHFLTYADNYAIGYFKKQGFTKSVSMARPNWYGYIKDYDGGTLMECTIHTQINYLRITSMIHMQRKAIQDKIKERSKSQTVYRGLTNFAEGRLMDIYMVPGVKEAGWSQAVIRNNRIGTRDQGSLKSQLSQLLKAVSNHRSAWPFHEPVDTSVVVDYLDHIKEPIDLQLISKRIDSGTYLSKAALKTDLEKMCDNCTTYNTPDTNYYKAAIDLREFIQSRIQIRDH